MMKCGGYCFEYFIAYNILKSRRGWAESFRLQKLYSAPEMEQNTNMHVRAILIRTLAHDITHAVYIHFKIENLQECTGCPKSKLTLFS